MTTISFPGPISAVDAAQVTADNKSPASFQIAHTTGTAFLSIRALARKVATNLNLRWNGKTYVLELVESTSPLYSVIFTPPPEPIERIDPVSVSPHRLLALLDKAKDYPLLKAYHPEAVMQVEYRNYAKEPRVTRAVRRNAGSPDPRRSGAIDRDEEISARANARSLAE